MQSSIRPFKRFSQHFLRDRFWASRIVDSLNIESGDHVLEIGSGEGALTEFLVKSSAERIVGVEIDSRLAKILREVFQLYRQLQIIEGDYLKTDFTSFVREEKKLRVIGNLPYSVTSPILFNLLENRSGIHDVVVTVQKEVGERITSPPGSKVYGIPSVLFQLFSETEMLFAIPGNAFYPVPKVDSVVLRITFLPKSRYSLTDEGVFRKVLKTAFGQRRKMLRNTLGTIVQKKEVLKRSSIDLSRRPEDLSIEEFVQLSNMLSVK